MSKKRAMTLLLALAMCLCLAAPASALEPGEEWVGDFVVRNGTTLVKYYGEDSTVTIPSGITKIGTSAFSRCTSLTSIAIPNGVTEIGAGAFSSCTNLTSVTIPNSVTTIGNSAFWGCASLTGVTIPNGVSVINEDTFNGCRSLTNITIPDSVVKIGFEAFMGCTALTSVTIPDGVTEIQNDAFAYCTSLTSATIPDSVTMFGYRAFNRCTSLTSVTIGSGVTTIQESMFEDCTSLTSITLPNSVTNIDTYAFRGCTSLTSVFIPLSVTTIRASMFEGCTSLTDLYYAGSAAQWKAVKNSSDIPNTVTIHYNSTMPEAPKPSVPTIVSTGVNPEASGTSYASTQTVNVDGKAVEFQMYALKNANGDPTNYVKLRDVADALDGTKAQFNVTWAEATGVGIQTGTAYSTRTGQEGKTPYTGNRGYQKGADTTQIDGAAVPLQAFFLTDDNGGDHTYYKLRDLGQALGFNVGYDTATDKVYIETDKPYDFNN